LRRYPKFVMDVEKCKLPLCFNHPFIGFEAGLGLGLFSLFQVMIYVARPYFRASLSN